MTDPKTNFVAPHLMLKPVRQLHAENKIPLPLRVTMALCHRKRFPAAKLGGKWYSTEDWIEKWIQKSKTPAVHDFLEIC